MMNSISLGRVISGFLVTLGLNALALSASLALAQAKPPYDLGKVLKDRDAAQATWLQTHATAEAGLAELKSKTEALVKAAGAQQLAANSNPVIWRVPGAPSELWGKGDLPELVVIPAGAFVMGSVAMAHTVTIATPFAMGKYPVTRGEYAHFFLDSGYQTQTGCSTPQGEQWALDPARSWRDPGFVQGANDPVVCVGWHDAVAFATWLSGKTGHKYRVATAAEYAYAAAAGTRSAFWFGDKASHEFMNYGVDDCSAASCQPAVQGRDQWLTTSPVGSFPANAFGLFDMTGNVSEWVADCGSSTNAASPVDGSADLGDCSKRVYRGGSWASGSSRSSAQQSGATSPAFRSNGLGFRVVRTL